MDLRQLRYFVAVAERSGFSAAASSLNVAQSALSRHVRELERELGGALFERGARGVSVTESGKMLLARGRWLFGAIDDIKAEVQTENREPSGMVRLGVPSSLADILYAPLARLFAQRFPRIGLELNEGLTEAVSDRLLRGELDLAIATSPQPNDHLDYETLVVEKVFLIGPPNDPLLRRGKLNRKEFRNLPAAVLPLSRNPFPIDVPFSVRVGSTIPMKQIVASGLGYALLPWLYADRVLALPRGRPVSRATRETITALKEVCNDLIRDRIILTTANTKAKTKASGSMRRAR